MGNALAGRKVAITRLPARRTVLGWRCHLSFRLNGCSFPLTDEETPEAMSTRGGGHQRGVRCGLTAEPRTLLLVKSTLRSHLTIT